MASGVEELLGLLYDMIEEGKSVPMHSEQCKIDRDRALDLLDEIKSQFPQELGEAQKIVNAREEYIASAKREVDAMRAQAQDQVKRMLNETEILRQAKDVANSMIRKAQEQSNQIRRAATEYCDDALKRTEESVTEAAGQVRQVRTQLRQMAQAQSSAARQNSGSGANAGFDTQSK
jgi:cell division septum initiation protein DivIVA